MDKKKIYFDCRWSNRLDAIFLKDYLFVQNEVFLGNYTKKQFRHKYVDNIFGPSVLCVVYIDGKPSAARALWRNDLNGKKAYQPVDTCVLSACRGKGVFSEMTKKAMELLSPGAIIYNFPNHNSFPGYIKMGWKSIHEYRMVLLTNLSEYRTLHPVKIDKKYLNWWLEGREDICKVKHHGVYFLVKKYPRALCYKVISEVDEELAKSFPTLKRPAFIFYSGLKKTFYNKRFATAHVVARCAGHLTIPVWKMDVI